MRRTFCKIIAVGILLFWSGIANAADPDPTMPSAKTPDAKPADVKPADAKPSEDAKNTAANREKKFTESLTGATLVGQYTMTGAAPAAPHEDKYTIESVTKLPLGDIYLFQARIQYGGRDTSLPLPLPIVWAGDTPMIALDKFAVPGFGTFTVRVFFYEDKYAGTWDAGDHGGFMFGKIVKEKK